MKDAELVRKAAEAYRIVSADGDGADRLTALADRLDAEEGELAKLRRLRERVMALPRYDYEQVPYTEDYELRPQAEGDWIRADDIDEALKECQ